MAIEPSQGWKKLTVDDLKLILSQDEITALDTLSKEVGIDRIQGCMNMVSDMWRGAFLAHGYSLYARPHWTPASYHYYILVHARYAIWTNFPMSPLVALDEARTKEYEKAKEILDKIPFAVNPIDYEDDPDLKDEPIPTTEGSIYVPWQRLDTCCNRFGDYFWNNWSHHRVMPQSGCGCCITR